METLQLVERGTDQGHLFCRDGGVPARIEERGIERRGRRQIDRKDERHIESACSSPLLSRKLLS